MNIFDYYNKIKSKLKRLLKKIIPNLYDNDLISFYQKCLSVFIIIQGSLLTFSNHKILLLLGTNLIQNGIETLIYNVKHNISWEVQFRIIKLNNITNITNILFNKYLNLSIYLYNTNIYYDLIIKSLNKICNTLIIRQLTNKLIYTIDYSIKNIITLGLTNSFSQLIFNNIRYSVNNPLQLIPIDISETALSSIAYSVITKEIFGKIFNQEIKIVIGTSVISRMLLYMKYFSYNKTYGKSSNNTSYIKYETTPSNSSTPNFAYKNKQLQIAQISSNNPIEDKIFVSDSLKYNNNNLLITGVYDGHGGQACSQYIINHIENIMNNLLSDNSNKMSLTDILQKTYEKLEQSFKDYVEHSHNKKNNYIGACALTSIIDPKNSKLYIANTGDAEAIILNENSYKKLGRTHASSVEQEKNLLISEHPNEEDIVVCYNKHACQTKGALMPTRSLGDFYLKDHKYSDNAPKLLTPPYIKWEPELIEYSISKDDKYLVLATDGLWDNLSGKQVFDYINNNIDSNNIAEDLKLLSLRKSIENYNIDMNMLMNIPYGSDRRRIHDDISIIVIDIKKLLKNNTEANN